MRKSEPCSFFSSFLLFFLLCTGRAARRLIRLDVAFLVPMLSRRRGGSTAECNFFWLAFPLRSQMSGCHSVSIKQSTGNSGKIATSDDLTSRCEHYAKDTDMEDIKADRRCWLWWRAVHLDYVMAAGYKKIYTTWCWNRCQPSALPLVVSLCSQGNELRGRRGEMRT